MRSTGAAWVSSRLFVVALPGSNVAARGSVNFLAVPGQLSLPHPLQETLGGIFYFFVLYFFPPKRNSNPIIIIGSILEVTVLNV